MENKKREYKGFQIENASETVQSTSPCARTFGRSGTRIVKGYIIVGVVRKQMFETVSEAKAFIDGMLNKGSATRNVVPKMSDYTKLMQYSSGTLSYILDDTRYSVIDEFREFLALHENKNLTQGEYVEQFNDKRK